MTGQGREKVGLEDEWGFAGGETERKKPPWTRTTWAGEAARNKGPVAGEKLALPNLGLWLEIKHLDRVSFTRACEDYKIKLHLLGSQAR